MAKNVAKSERNGEQYHQQHQAAGSENERNIGNGGGISGGVSGMAAKRRRNR